MNMTILQGAIMAVGASEPNVVATKDGRIGVKNQMQVRMMTKLILAYKGQQSCEIEVLATPYVQFFSWGVWGPAVPEAATFSLF